MSAMFGAKVMGKLRGGATGQAVKMLSHQQGDHPSRRFSGTVPDF